MSSSKFKCKDCREYKEVGFSPLCKYCKIDGSCPECGEQLTWGKETMYECKNGHKWDVKGQLIKIWNPSER